MKVKKYLFVFTFQKEGELCSAWSNATATKNNKKMTFETFVSDVKKDLEREFGNVVILNIIEL